MNFALFLGGLRPNALHRNGGLSFHDADKLSHRTGYWMVGCLCFSIANFLYSVISAFEISFLYGVIVAATQLVFYTGFTLFMICRVFKLPLRNAWSLWFSYTVMVSNDRIVDETMMGLWGSEFVEAVRARLTLEVAGWCRDNINGLWCQWSFGDGRIFKFNCKKDAALFKLFWG